MRPSQDEYGKVRESGIWESRHTRTFATSTLSALDSVVTSYFKYGTVTTFVGSPAANAGATGSVICAATAAASPANAA